MTGVARTRTHYAAPDVQITDNGTLVRFWFHNTEALEWFDENVETEGWAWLGSFVVNVGHRYAEAIIEGLMEEGYTCGH